jgi:hypothetical protein
MKWSIVWGLTGGIMVMFAVSCKSLDRLPVDKEVTATSSPTNDPFLDPPNASLPQVLSEQAQYQETFQTGNANEVVGDRGKHCPRPVTLRCLQVGLTGRKGVRQPRGFADLMEHYGKIINAGEHACAFYEANYRGHSISLFPDGIVYWSREAIPTYYSFALDASDLHNCVLVQK